LNVGEKGRGIMENEVVVMLGKIFWVLAGIQITLVIFGAVILIALSDIGRKMDILKRIFRQMGR